MPNEQTSPTASASLVERLRAAGYAVVPITPTDEMLKAGAPARFQAYNRTTELSLSDAAECYQAMVEIGRLR